MPKTFKRLYPEICSFENVLLAYRRARRHKRYKEPAAYFAMHEERNLLQLHRELQERTWHPGDYHHFYVYEPKKRKISAAPFRDRIVHHALVNVLEPLYERRFSEASFACRKEKGTHAAIERAHWGVRNCPFFFKGDVRRFYPSVDHEILKSVLFHKIADGDVRRMIGLILESGAGILDEEACLFRDESDDLLSPLLRPRGLPIGNLTSQFFANAMLNELDQFVHHRIKPRLYVRYMDDFLLFDGDKEKLNAAQVAVSGQLASMRLRLHEEKSCVRTSAQGVKFLGFRLTPQTRRIDRENLSRFRRRMRRLRAARRAGEATVARISASVRGWLAHADHANTTAIVRKVLCDVRI